VEPTAHPLDLVNASLQLRPDADGLAGQICEINAALLIVLIGVLVGAMAGTFTLAFGLGSRDVARALSAGRYRRHDYQVGEDIAFGDVRGRITRIHSTTTILDAGEGRSIRVPNHLLIDSIVTVYGIRQGVETGPQ